MLRQVAAIPLLAVGWAGLATVGRAAPPHSAHRVRPSDPSWPSAASWEQLNREAGGHLIRVQSPLAACTDAADNAACREILQSLKNPYFIGDQPGLTQSFGWVDTWLQAPSVYAVAARTTADVAAAVNFARANNLRLVVKGGGHSYLGTSNAADSLLIWTRAMNGIVLHDAFVAQGCAGAAPPQPAVTVEAGAIWVDVYDAVTTKAGRYVQGGGCVTVRVAGLIQGGGFGSFSKNYGTAASWVLEAEIVTADGVVRIANACTNPDLFWAIKGGGGGSLGVITRLTLRTHELPALFGGALLTIKATSETAFAQLISRFFKFYRDSLFNPHWGESVTLRPGNVLAVRMVSQDLDKQQAENVWQSFLDWVRGSPRDFTLATAPVIGSIPARNWWDADYRRKNLPNTMHTDDRPGADAFGLAIIARGRAAYPGIPGHEPDLALARKEAGKVDQAMAELRKIAPNAGSYVSETNFSESDWQRSFWGANYPQLQAVKAKYDPDGLFFVHHGVGSEEWSDDGFTRLSGSHDKGD
jgi:FAD/FMN-containing dehydrogenase